jgi:hypothetical protein
VLFPSFFVVIFRALSCAFLGRILSMISWGFLVGVTYEDLVPLWLVTLPPISLDMDSIWSFFELAEFLT